MRNYLSMRSVRVVQAAVRSDRWLAAVRYWRSPSSDGGAGGHCCSPAGSKYIWITDERTWFYSRRPSVIQFRDKWDPERETCVLIVSRDLRFWCFPEFMRQTIPVGNLTLEREKESVESECAVVLHVKRVFVERSDVQHIFSASGVMRQISAGFSLGFYCDCFPSISRNIDIFSWCIFTEQTHRSSYLRRFHIC